MFSIVKETRMNIESKIRLKAISLYLIAGIGLAVIGLLFYGLKRQVDSERMHLQNQQKTLAGINALIKKVGEAQSTANLFLISRNTVYIHQYDSMAVAVSEIIAATPHSNKAEQRDWNEIARLLRLQSANLRTLNQYFHLENPVNKLNTRLKEYKPQLPTESQIAATKPDTLVKVRKKRTFFGRIKNVFSPSVDSTLVIRNEKTIRVQSTESPAIIAEMKEIAQQAGTHYDENIRSINQNMLLLIESDRELAARITSLLMKVQDKTLRGMMNRIALTEASLNKSYLISGIAGALALLLILVFITLIIYDVNKGREAREKLKEVMESRHQFLLSVSHDIKSPLSSIYGYLELQTEGAEKRAMQNSVNHITALLENLLEFSAIEQGTLSTTRQTFELNALRAEMEQMFRPLVERKQLHFESSATAIRICTDRMKLKQILINLVSNAVKYTPLGSIRLEMIAANGNLSVKVTDTGAGIPSEKLSDLFKPFTRVERNNALAHGSGLGMYVVKGLVEILGGTIHVESIPDEGTTFTVELPVDEIRSSVAPGQKKIAVFDDDPVMVRMVTDLLHRLGHEVVESDYDLILTDMEMDEISGLDVLHSAEHLPVVVMTGRSDFSYEKAIQLGFTDYIAKPFTQESLQLVFGAGKPAGVDDFLGEDEDEILQIFKESTAQNFQDLSLALAGNDYFEARRLCHKMLPMFVLLGYPSDELKRMDQHRDAAYEHWQEDVSNILTIKV
ncbi:MAG: hypothetical protein RIS29_2674 [Bacteroidota bacterium]